MIEPRQAKDTKDITLHDEDFNLWNLLAATRHMMHRARQQELRQYNISPRQSAVMVIVEAIGDKATPAAITRWTFRKSHTVSEILTRMEKQELLRKVKDMERKNQVRVELTAKGREVFSQSLKRESMHRIMSVLSPKEQEQLESSLRKLRKATLRELGIEKDFVFFPLSY